MTVIDPPANNSSDISSPEEGTVVPLVETTIEHPTVLALDDELSYWRNRLLEDLYFQADGLRRLALGVAPRKRHVLVVRVLGSVVSNTRPRRGSLARRAPDESGELA